MIKKFLKRCIAVTLAVSLVTGLAPVNTAPVRNVKEAKAAETSDVMGSDNYVTQANISVGSTYKFDNYNWIAAEASGNKVVLQSKGVTGGYWPGYTIWGNNSYHGSSIDGRDISSYDTKTQNLYNAIKYAEYKGNTAYGSSGLYLVSKSTVESSTNYCQALKDAAVNWESFGAGHNLAWLGTVDGSAWAYFVGSGGGVSSSVQVYPIVVAPAFNLDKSKVTVNSNNEIVPFSASTGIKATKSSIQSIKEGESIDLSSVIGGVTYVEGTAAGKSASYRVSCDKGTINGTTYTAPRDVKVGDDTVTFTITSTRNSGWTSSVQVDIAQKYVNVSYDVAINGGTSATPSSVQDIDIDTVYDASSSVLSVGKDTVTKPNWTFVGWNTDPNAHKALTSLKMDSDKTLYAIFKKDLTITFKDVGN